MKIKLNHIIKSLIFILFISLTSCEKELYEDSIQNSSRNLTIQHINLKDIDKAISTKIESKISAINKTKERNKGLENRFEYNSNLNIYIDTDKGKLINNNGKISYTFPIFRKNEDKLENIIFNLLPDGNLDTFLSKYNIKHDDFEKLTIYEIQNLNPELSKVAFLNVVTSILICVEQQIAIPIDVPEGVMDGNPNDVEYIWETTQMNCTWITSGGGDNNNNNNTNNNNSDYNTGNDGFTSGTGPSVSTSPTISNSKKVVREFLSKLADDDQLENCFNNNLTDDKKAKILDFVGSLETEELENEDDCPNNPSTNQQVFDFLSDLIQSQCEGGDNANNSWNDFENQFLIPSEGQDFFYNENYWNNPSQNLPQQNLPSYNDYYNGFPRNALGVLMTVADNVYGLVGGKVLLARNQYPIETENTCALKVSIALTRSGISIPDIPGQTVEGGGIEFTGKFFFLNAKSLNSWMRKTFGTNPATNDTPLNENHLSYSECDGGKNGILFGPLLNNKYGIYSLITKSGKISGHADLLFPSSSGNTGTTIFGPNFNLPVERIDVWILN